MNARISFVAVSISFLIGCAAYAQETPEGEGRSVDDIIEEEFSFDREGERCINTRAIRNTDIIDERTILFRMRGRDYFVNYLPHSCRSLVREERFSYRASSGRLCQVDTIRVLEQFGGIIQEGMSCGLGPFYPITEEEADFLRLEPEERRGRPRIQISNPNAEASDASDVAGSSDEAGSPQEGGSSDEAGSSDETDASDEAEPRESGE